MKNLHQVFGKTGLRVPKLVFGATTLGNLFVAPSNETKQKLIQSWFDHVDSPVAIDTAGKYGAGLSLEVIGRELAAAQIDPKDVIISNKLAWRRVPLTGSEPTFEPGVWIDLKHDAVQDISYDGILRCFEDGKRFLGEYTQHLVSVHDPDEYLAAATDPGDRKKRLENIVGAYRALVELRDAREVFGVGVGSKTWSIVKELEEYCCFDWVMLANSLTIMHHPPELLDYVQDLADRNIALINSALTHGGFLVGGKFLDYREINVDDPADQRCLQWRDDFQAACEELGQSAFEVAVAFGSAHPAVTSVALSSSRPNRTEQLIDAATRTLPADVWSTLQQRGLISWIPPI